MGLAVGCPNRRSGRKSALDRLRRRGCTHGTARKIYTFGRHLMFTPLIALGYAASIAGHMLLNVKYFH